MLKMVESTLLYEKGKNLKMVKLLEERYSELQTELKEDFNPSFLIRYWTMMSRLDNSINLINKDQISWSLNLLNKIL